MNYWGFGLPMKALLADATPEVIAKRLWDLLREDCCATKTKARCIVMVHEPDVKRAVARLLAQDAADREWMDSENSVGLIPPSLQSRIDST